MPVFKTIKEYYFRLSVKQRRWLFILLTGLLLSLLTMSALASYYYFRQQTDEQITTPSNQQQTHPSINLNTPAERNQLNILLLGYGGPGHQGGMLTDLIQVLNIDFVTKRLNFISIPRDLEIVTDSGHKQKINSLLSYYLNAGQDFPAASQSLQDDLTQVLGLNIDYTISVDFVGFQRLIGQTMGEIEVEVNQTLDDPWYPIEGKQLDPCDYSAAEIAQLTNTLSGFELESQFACRYEQLYYEPGLHIMEGKDALAYVRSRHSSSDFDRSRRQSEVLIAIRNKLFDLEVLRQIPYFFNQVSQHVTSNLDLASAEYLGPLLLNAREFTSHNVNLSTDNVLTSGQDSNGFILLPKTGPNNWIGIQQFIQQQLDQE